MATQAAFFSGIRNNGESIVIKVASNKQVTTSQGYSRPLDAARWKKANESIEEYLRLLLALKAKPVPASELEYKSECKLYTVRVKADNLNNLRPEGPVAEQDATELAKAIDNAYESEAYAKQQYAIAKAERMGLVAYAKGSKATKAPTKAELRKEAIAAVQRGESLTAEQLMAAGFVPKAKA